MNTYQTIAYFNTHRDDLRTHVPMMDGYRQGDSLQHSEWVRHVDIDADSVLKAASIIFAGMNSDDRPNGQDERSLSVGDVIYLIDHETGDETWLAIAGCGFEPIPTPRQFRPNLFLV